MDNMRFDGYGYPDMNLINNMFSNNNSNSNHMNSTDNNLNNNINTGTNQNLVPPYEGYIRGNMFNNLYQQYMNYRPTRLVPDNEQAELLLNANQLSFAALDIRLYLDVHPNDAEMISLYNQYQHQANEAIKNYEEKYGPILQNSSSAANRFSWEAYAWPWEMEVK